jgi:3-hydroxyisobutyrate dehydrogenase
MSNIAWIGLGKMGLPMASNLVNAGFTVRGFEVSPAAADAGRAAGIEIYRTATEAVQEAQTVFTMLPNGHIVEQMLTGPDGVFAHVAAGTLVVDSSTIGIATCRKLHQAAQPVGIDYLDAPVSGGVEGAQAGTLTFMVGSEGAVFTRVRPLLDVMGHNIVHVGPVGAGLAAKIVNNMVLGVNLSAVCEAVTLGEHLGLKPRALYDIVKTSTGSSWVWDHWYPVEGVAENAPSDHGYAPGFKTSLLLKDIGLALDAGEFAGVPLATATTAHQLFEDHADVGYADLDCSSLYLSLDKAAEKPPTA